MAWCVDEGRNPVFFRKHLMCLIWSSFGTRVRASTDPHSQSCRGIGDVSESTQQICIKANSIFYKQVWIEVTIGTPKKGLWSFSTKTRLPIQPFFSVLVSAVDWDMHACILYCLHIHTREWVHTFTHVITSVRVHPRTYEWISTRMCRG